MFASVASHESDKVGFEVVETVLEFGECKVHVLRGGLRQRSRIVEAINHGWRRLCC